MTETSEPLAPIPSSYHKPNSGTALDDMRLSLPLGFDAAYACDFFSAVRLDAPSQEMQLIGRSVENMQVTVWGEGTHSTDLKFCGTRLPDRTFTKGACSVVASGTDWEFNLKPSKGSNFVFFINPKKFADTFEDDAPAGRCIELQNDVHAHDHYLVGRMGAYLEEHKRAREFAGIGMQTIAMEVSLHLARNYSGWVERGRLSHISVTEPERIARAKDYIDACLDQPLSLADIAQVACLSQYHFSRCFKALEGLSPYQYVVKQRLERAREMLCNPDLTLSAIAHSCGFSSQQHMTDQFRKAYGDTPGRTRQKLGLVAASPKSANELH